VLVQVTDRASAAWIVGELAVDVVLAPGARGVDDRAEHL
jgi:hypothetical protein